MTKVRSEGIRPLTPNHDRRPAAVGARSTSTGAGPPTPTPLSRCHDLRCWLRPATPTPARARRDTTRVVSVPHPAQRCEQASDLGGGLEFDLGLLTLRPQAGKGHGPGRGTRSERSVCRNSDHFEGAAPATNRAPAPQHHAPYVHQPLRSDFHAALHADRDGTKRRDHLVPSHRLPSRGRH